LGVFERTEVIYDEQRKHNQKHERTRFTNSRIDVDKEQLVFLYSKNVNNTIMLKGID
jgi:hypothetical protein